MFTIRRIGIASAFRVGLVGGAVMAAITGLLFILLQGLFLSFIGSLLELAMLDSTSGSVGMSGSGDFGGVLAAFSLATACIFYVVMIVFSAVFGGISGALIAFVYNLTARWIGGLEIEMTGSLEKAKRSPDDDLYA
jgi:hypothetical protein